MSAQDAYHPQGETPYSRGRLRMRVPFDRPTQADTIPGRFSEIARLFPHQPAIIASDQVLTYQELDKRSEALAALVLAQNPDADTPVAILTPDGVQAVVAILAVLKAGRYYLPLAADWPHGRLERILVDSHVETIISVPEHEGLVSGLGDRQIKVLNVDQDPGTSFAPLPPQEISANSRCVVFYTSGTTGQPKGIVRKHRNLLESAWEAYHYGGLMPLDRVAYIYSHAFAGSINDIFYGLLSGGTLCHFPVREQSLHAFIEWLREQRISVLHPPVSLLRDLMEALQAKRSLPDIRLLIMGGDSVRLADIEQFKRCFGEHVLMLIRYVTTETGCITLFHIDNQTVLETETVPVGYARPDVQVMILDDERKPIPHGELGEIAVRSPNIFSEYAGQAEPSTGRFIQDAERGDSIYLTGDLGRLGEDGLLEHLGRKDSAVKIRNYLVHLDGVEAALLEIPGVADAAVIARQHADGENMLTAFLVTSEGADLPIAKIREELVAALPAYMIPARFVSLERLPRSLNGKLDRRALPALSSARPTLDELYAAPRTPFEQSLAAIWAEVLGLDQVGINDRFLDLGGHSLLAGRIVSRVVQSFGVDLSPQILFQAPTVAEMAALLFEQGISKMDDTELKDMLSDLEEGQTR